MPDLAFDEIVLPNAPQNKDDQFDEVIPPAVEARREEISAKPTFLDSVSKGDLGEAYYLAKDFLGRVLAPTSAGRMIEPGHEGLLGTTEQIPAHPDDSLPVRAAKAIVNVGNRTMSGMTTPEMLPLLVIGGAPGATGRIVAGGFAASQAPAIPEAIKKTIESPTASQAQFENALDTLFLSAFTAGGAKLALPGEAKAAARDSGRTEPARISEDFDEVIAPKQEVRVPETFDEIVPPSAATPPSSIVPPEVEQMRGSIGEREKALAATEDPAERQQISKEIVDLRGQLGEIESRYAEQQSFESAWAAVPNTTRDRMLGELRDRGVDEEQIAKMTPIDVRNELAKPLPSEDFTPPAPREEEPLSEEEIARREYESELRGGFEEAQAAHGDELVDAVVKAGALPKPGTPEAGNFSGELADLETYARDPNRTDRSIKPNKLFGGTQDLDTLATNLRDRGFDVQTPADVISLLKERFQSGRKLFGTPERASAMEEFQATHAMGAAAPKPAATAAATPHRAPTTPPVSPVSPIGPTPAVAAAAKPVMSWWQQRTLGIRKLVAPQTIDAPARMVANIIRDYNGELANTIVQADHALATARKEFDRTPVPRNWKYDPNKPLPRNYAFIDNSERGGAGLSMQDRQLKSQIDKMFSEAVDEVHRVKPQALQSLIQDYFPHIWEDPEQARQVFAQIMSKRPLEGPKGFLKKRVLEYTIDGLKAGLRPASDNPIDMALTKLHEVHRFVAAQDILSEAKAIGARKFVYVFERAPDGWTRVDDPTSTVHGPPFVTVPEAFDEQLRAKTVELLQKLGVRHDRVAALRGQRWGEASRQGQPPGAIRTRFAGPMSVYWHELGHVLQYRYGWLDQIAYDAKRTNLGGKSEIEKQLRSLADLRVPDAGASKSFKSYIRTKDEKSAVILEAYLHAPERVKQVAPNVYTRVKKFIAAHPELHGIEEIRPNVALGSAKQAIPVGGMVTLGHWYMPAGAAQVLTNYLSPGLQRFGIIRSIRQSTNILSGLQLGFSAFHAGFTSIDAAVSQFALGLRYLSEGKVIKAGEKILTTPAAPITNFLTGRRVQKAMLDPASSTPAVRQIAELAVQAGLRATVDPFWRTQITRNMLRAWHEGGVKGYAGTALRLPFAISEQLMRPILEYLVPRQKLGVFAGMAQAHMERLGPNADVHAVRDAMARAADATEDRMGQMTYDNLFYHRVIRDAALLSFRAYGWTFGKYRALFGGASDILQTPGRVRAGGPVLSDRMAYLLALPMVAAGIGSIMNYAMTGQPPNDWKDAIMPRTGNVDRHGNPQRLSLPTYAKDLLSDWHDFPNPKKMFLSFYHKLNPWIDVAANIINNADFYGTKIYSPADPAAKQVSDAILYVGKSATPFSVTSAAKLNESHPSIMQQILPFFGFVPAKQELTMTPAQLRAAELYQDTLPRGARSPDKAEQSQLISQLMRDMKAQDPKWRPQLEQMLASGQLQPSQLGQIFRSLPLNPMQYQAKKLSAEDAMKVWDLANPAEREQIRPILLQKIFTARTLLPSERARFIQLLTQTK